MKIPDILQPGSKKFVLMAMLFVLGIMLILVGSCDTDSINYGAGEKPPGTGAATGTGEPVTAANSLMTREEKELATELRQMLEQVAGAGRVEVSVQLAASTNNDYAINTTTGLKTTSENDQSGGSRQITENTDTSTVVIARGEQGLEEPVVKKQVAPDVDGIMVVAQGADIPRVKADLFRAVQVALGVEPHKIIVLPMEKGA